MADARELRLALEQPVVGAGERARADVADVHDEGERLRVHLVDQRVEALDLGLGVGRVAQHAEATRSGAAAARARSRQAARPALDAVGLA